MTAVVRVDGQVGWHCVRGNENWVAVCDALKLTVQAETWGDLMEDIGDTLDAVLKDLASSNELPQFLTSNGWHLATPLPAQLNSVQRFDLPFTTVVGSRGPQANVHQ
jgi:predicted RNase H-like HicB family nuclease